MSTRVIGLVLMLSAALVGCETVPTDQYGETDTAPSGSLQARSQLYANLAAAYLREGQLEVALSKGRRALELDSGNAAANNVMALVYQRLGEPERAERHFRRALDAAPGNAYYLNAYGSFLCARERLDEALERFDKAAANPLNRSPEVALTNAGICTFRRTGDASEAESYFRRALERNAEFPAALLWMARVSLENEEYLSARGYVQRYEAVAEHTAESLWLAVRAERRLGDRNTAARYAMMLRSRFPDAPEVQRLRESGTP